MDAHASMPQGYKDAPTNFRNPYQSQPFFQPMVYTLIWPSVINIVRILLLESILEVL